MPLMASRSAVVRGRRWQMSRSTAAGKIIKAGSFPRRAAAPAAGVDEKLLDALYAVRRDLARREKLPAFMIFPDAVLRDICQRRPRTTADLLAISGIGEVKAARYGPAFLEAVRKGG